MTADATAALPARTHPASLLGAFFPPAGRLGRLAALAPARIGAAADPAPPPPPRDAELERIDAVVRLYRLLLRTVPDRPGLLHHARLLAEGSPLRDLAASLLSVAQAAGVLPAAGGRGAGRLLWQGAGGDPAGFEAAWRAAADLPGFVSALVGGPLLPGCCTARALFPAGFDPASDGAWSYRLWASEMEAVLLPLAARLMPVLRLFGPRIVLELEPGGDPGAEALRRTLRSLSAQLYGRWRLQLRGPLPPGVVLPRDRRISLDAGAGGSRFPRGGIRAGEVLSPCCLALFAFAVLRRPLAGRWSCDADSTRPAAPVLERDAGLVLRRGAGRSRGRHLPAVLLHRAQAVPTAAQASPAPRCPPPSVSVVIATRDRPALLRRCLDTLADTTREAPPEIVLVDNGSVDPDALGILAQAEAEGCRVLRRPGRFNWSALCNQGVRASCGAVVVLMNNDVACLRPGWLPLLAAACDDPLAGVAGARLLRPDGSLQHAGVLLGPGPVAVHRWAGEAERGLQPVSAVTGACMAFRRTLFERLGGLEERLPVTWNDLDFCLRARRLGLQNRLAADCVLQHDELGTRTPDHAAENRAQLRRTLRFVARRHRRALRRGDPFLHPFLLLADGGRSIDPAAPDRLATLLLGGGVD